MFRYAVLDRLPNLATAQSPATVVQVALWNGTSAWALGDRAVLVPPGLRVTRDWLYDGANFAPLVVREPLDTRKTRLLTYIDERTEYEITNGPGFEWPPASGQFFSLSMNAQTKWLGMMAAAAFFDYVNDPPKVRTKDDRIEYTLTSQVEVVQATTTALEAVRAFLTTGRIDKGIVLDCPTHEDLDALIVAKGWTDSGL